MQFSTLIFLIRKFYNFVFNHKLKGFDIDLYLLVCVITIQFVFFWIYTKISIYGTLFYISISVTAITGIISLSFNIKRKIRDRRKAKSNNTSNTGNQINSF
jgi:hypothetical protein